LSRTQLPSKPAGCLGASASSWLLSRLSLPCELRKASLHRHNVPVRCAHLKSHTVKVETAQQILKRAGFSENGLAQYRRRWEGFKGGRGSSGLLTSGFSNMLSPVPGFSSSQLPDRICQASKEVSTVHYYAATTLRHFLFWVNTCWLRRPARSSMLSCAGAGVGSTPSAAWASRSPMGMSITWALAIALSSPGNKIHTALLKQDRTAL